MSEHLARVDAYHKRFADRFVPRELILSAARYLAFMLACVLIASLLLKFAAGASWRTVTVPLSAYSVMAALVLAGLPAHGGQRSFGTANALTLMRAAITTVFFGISADTALTDALASNTLLRWILTVAGTAGLLLDGFDGWIARRNGMATEFGARFDMEADSLLMLALALLVYSSGATGAWVIVSGLLRYLFVVAGLFWAPLAAPLLPSARRKVIYFMQMAILIVVLAPVIASHLGWMLCGAGLCLLGYSFSSDCLWLATRARSNRLNWSYRLWTPDASPQIPGMQVSGLSTYRSVHRSVPRADITSTAMMTESSSRGSGVLFFLRLKNRPRFGLER